MKKNIKNSLVAAAILMAAAGSAYATNGMLMEGYGPISHAMGGTGAAFDNGNGGMAINPATLGLMKDKNRVDVAFGVLMPDVTYSDGNGRYDSDATKFVMPAAGYIRKEGDFTFGAGVYSQGGMGTDYMNNHVPGMYSQVIIAKLILPGTWQVNDKLIIGGTLEYIQAGMDLVYGPFHFKNGSDFSGSATGHGISGKLGVLYKLTDRVNVGAVYQHKGNIGDLTGHGATVKGLDMPSSAKIGVAVQATDKLLLALDYQKIFWSNTMKEITVSQNGISNPLAQYWEDQNVVSLGLAYQATPQLTLRAGASFANNPIEKNNTALFPAIMKNHYTAGFGYRFNQNHSVDMSLAYAPKVEVTNEPSLGFTGTTTHKQMAMQFMYSYRF